MSSITTESASSAAQTPVHPTSASAPKSWFSKALHSLPTLMTFALLGAVGWFGHHSGWKLSKFSALQGASPAKNDEWCAEHNVPEAECVECRTELMPANKKPRWCKLHGVSECPACHPELAQVAGEPKLPRYDTVAAINQFARLQNNSRCTKFTRRIQFASVEAFEKTGIDVDVVAERPMLETLKLHGELTYDQTRVAHLSTRVPGTVTRVFKRLGDSVQAGEILALVDSLDVGKAKAELSKAVVQSQLRAKTLASLQKNPLAGSRQDLREAEAAGEESQVAMISAQQALVNLGFDPLAGLEEADVKQLTRQLQCLGLPGELCDSLTVRGNLTMNLIPIRAPQDGMIVEMDLVAGEIVAPDKPIATVANLRQMWLTLHAKQEDARVLSIGQSVRFRADGAAEHIVGEIDWISPSVQDVTRTLQVRATLPNKDGRLIANSFGTGEIVLREEAKAVTVPIDAVQSDGDCQIVFVRDKNFLKASSPKVFHVRQVRTAARDERFVELLAGVLPSEIVASKGSAALRAELLKSEFGEGECCGHHH